MTTTEMIDNNVLLIAFRCLPELIVLKHLICMLMFHSLICPNPTVCMLSTSHWCACWYVVVTFLIWLSAVKFSNWCSVRLLLYRSVLVFVHGDLTWDRLHLMISRSTTPELIKMVHKLEEFFTQQRTSSKRVLSAFGPMSSASKAKVKQKDEGAEVFCAVLSITLVPSHLHAHMSSSWGKLANVGFLVSLDLGLGFYWCQVWNYQQTVDYTTSQKGYLYHLAGFEFCYAVEMPLYSDKLIMYFVTNTCSLSRWPRRTRYLVLCQYCLVMTYELTRTVNSYFTLWTTVAQSPHKL